MGSDQIDISNVLQRSVRKGEVLRTLEPKRSDESNAHSDKEGKRSAMCENSKDKQQIQGVNRV